MVIDPTQPLYTYEYLYFDRYTGGQLSGTFEYGIPEESSTCHIINEMTYDLHFGSILGFPGRILMCLASFIAASLPVSGFFVWWGKRKKSP